MQKIQQNGMKDKRLPGQSQLDYLWVNYGSYSVSNTIEEDSIPTTALLTQLVNKVSDDSVNSLSVVGNNLVGTNISGGQLFSLDISELTTGGKSIVEFGKRYITEEDVNNGIDIPVNTPVYFLKFSDGTQLVTEISDYKGVETSSIVINIRDTTVQASLKINNEDSITPIIETDKGVKVDLKLSPQDSSVQLSKQLDGLKAQIILDNQGRELKFKLLSLSEYLSLSTKDTTTVYFIEGEQYFYFGEYLIGNESTNLDNYYTKDEINNLHSNLVTEQKLNDTLSELGMDWNLA